MSSHSSGSKSEPRCHPCSHRRLQDGISYRLFQLQVVPSAPWPWLNDSIFASCLMATFSSLCLLRLLHLWTFVTWMIQAISSETFDIITSAKILFPSQAPFPEFLGLLWTYFLGIVQPTTPFSSDVVHTQNQT